MTTLVKKTADGEIVVDCGPVEEYGRVLAETCLAGKPARHADLFKLAEDMDREQLRLLATILTAKADLYARMFKQSFSSSHAALLEEMRELRRIAKEQGEDLWPELG